MNKAKADQDSNVWYLNFASASAPARIMQPWEIARGWHDKDRFVEEGIAFLGDYHEGVNKKLDTFFNDEVKDPGRYGTILLDYPHDPRELLAAIIKTNSDKFRKVK